MQARAQSRPAPSLRLWTALLAMALAVGSSAAQTLIVSGPTQVAPGESIQLAVAINPAIFAITVDLAVTQNPPRTATLSYVDTLSYIDPVVSYDEPTDELSVSVLTLAYGGSPPIPLGEIDVAVPSGASGSFNVVFDAEVNAPSGATAMTIAWPVTIGSGGGSPVVRVPSDEPTLAAAVAAVEPGGEILIQQTTTFGQTVVITKPMTIRAQSTGPRLVYQPGFGGGSGGESAIVVTDQAESVGFERLTLDIASSSPAATRLIDASATDLSFSLCTLRRVGAPASTSSIDGGLVRIASANLTATSTSWNAGVARRGGLVASSGGGRLSFTNCAFITANAETGGGVFIDADAADPVPSELFIAASSFTSLRATSGGGAVFFDTARRTDASVEIRESAFSNCHEIAGGAAPLPGVTPQGGAAVYLTDFPNTTFFDVDLSGCSTAEGSGAVLVRSTAAAGPPSLLRFERVTATNNAACPIELSEPSANSSSIEVLDSEFRDNVGRFRAGAVTNVNTASILIEDCAFENNEGQNFGGAVEVSFASSGVSTLRSSTFISNAVRSAEDGGGAQLRGGSLHTVEDCLFRRNSAEDDGGGLAIVSADEVEVINCRFEGNEASDAGGGLYVIGSTEGRLIQSVLVGNGASRGGAVGVITSAPTGSPSLAIASSTLTHNESADGPDLFVDASADAVVVNTVMRSPADASAFDNAIGGPGFVTVEHSNVLGRSGVGVIDLEPLFVRDPSPESDDFGDLAYNAGSPGIDAGATLEPLSMLATDILGLPRALDDLGTLDTGFGPAPLIDLGAFEFQFSSASVRCGLADVAFPFRSLDTNDLRSFVASPARELAPPTDRADAFDVIEYIGLYEAGCPGG
ncbi:MAG: hypothetical protein CMJ31_14630 [Phycisphaerae bacterium]|nr:hypothetical protein [Phycisphaerae bacterium]